MRDIMYKVVFADGGYTETPELSQAKYMKANSDPGATIEAYERVYKVLNDPLGPDHEYSTYDEMLVAAQQLRDQFAQDEQRVLMDPQPEGLND